MSMCLPFIIPPQSSATYHLFPILILVPYVNTLGSTATVCLGLALLPVAVIVPQFPLQILHGQYAVTKHLTVFNFLPCFAFIVFTPVIFTLFFKTFGLRLHILIIFTIDIIHSNILKLFITHLL